MAESLEPNKLRDVGFKITSLGYALAAIVENKIINNENSLEINKLEVLSISLILIGDNIILKSILLRNQETCTEQDFLSEAEVLGLLSAKLYIIADLTAFRSIILKQNSE